MISPVITLNESASSPSWSRARTGITWVKSRLRRCSVPVKRSCTAPVICRASVSPSSSATDWMMRKSTPTTVSSASATPLMALPRPGPKAMRR